MTIWRRQAAAWRGAATNRPTTTRTSRSTSASITRARRDFLHSLSRNWREVTWVAAACYMTQAQARERFKKYSGDEYQKAEYKVDRELKDLGGADNRERAKFWEIWHKGMNTVVWVAEGCEDVLDKADPEELAKLSNFFPCPKPAYSATQPGSLIPVPDVLQYKDQLDEVNTLTGRLHALSQCLEVKGFYPAAAPRSAMPCRRRSRRTAPGRVLIPISNWAAFGGSKEVIVWMPIDMIAQTITSVIAVSKQIIEDIYQIMGLSDIMRGATDPGETLGAQQLKSQYGSVRIRDKQGEMVRVARDIEEITAEIMCSDFAFETLMEMSQMEIPTEAEQQQKIMAMQQQLQMMTMQAQQQMQQTQPGMPGAPGAQVAAQQNPEQLKQLEQQFMQLKGNLEDETAKPTQERVEQFLKDYRTTAFVLDIETDSTIQPNEDAEKQRRGEFMGMMAQLLPQLAALIAQEPGAAEFAGELLKFSVSRRSASAARSTARSTTLSSRSRRRRPRTSASPIPSWRPSRRRSRRWRRSRCRSCNSRRTSTPASSRWIWPSCKPTIRSRRRSCKESSGSRCSRRRPRKRRTWLRSNRYKPRRRWTPPSISSRWWRATRRWRSTRRSPSRRRWTRRTATQTWRSGGR